MVALRAAVVYVIAGHLRPLFRVHTHNFTWQTWMCGTKIKRARSTHGLNQV